MLDCAYFLSYCLEHLFDPGPFPRWDLWPNHSILLSERYRSFSLHSLLFNGQVTLISAEGHNEAVLIGGGVCAHLVDPVLDGLEGGLVWEVVADNGADCIPIVHVYHWAEPFMATCVPNMHLHLLLNRCCGTFFRLLRLLYANDFLEVCTTDCHIVHFIEAILTET